MVLTGGNTFVDATEVRRPIATNRYGVHYRHRGRNMTTGELPRTGKGKPDEQPGVLPSCFAMGLPTR